MGRSVTVQQVVQLGVHRDDFQVLVDHPEQTHRFIRDLQAQEELFEHIRQFEGSELLGALYGLCGVGFPDDEWKAIVTEGGVPYTDSIPLNELFYWLRRFEYDIAPDLYAHIMEHGRNLKWTRLHLQALRLLSIRVFAGVSIDEHERSSLEKNARCGLPATIHAGIALMIARPDLLEESGPACFVFAHPSLFVNGEQRYCTLRLYPRHRFRLDWAPSSLRATAEDRFFSARDESEEEASRAGARSS